MKPEDIRKLYREEGEATSAEAAETERQVRTNADMARTHLATVYALSTIDRDFAHLLRLFLEGKLMEMIQARAEQDDAYALSCGNLLLDLMQAMKPLSVQRGKPKRSTPSA